MPHIHLRTSANLVENVDIGDILESLVWTLAAFETIDPKSIKAYHTLHTHWAMGAGAQPGFAAAQIVLAQGRDETLLNQIGDAMYAELQRGFASSLENDEVNLTLEVREFAKERYRKES